VFARSRPPPWLTSSTNPASRIAARARPFDLFASILTGEGFRARFAARMGEEAEDALDAFLDLALDAEANGIAALEPFLLRLSRLSAEIRRAPGSAQDRVRVMTVHGAKGLEADVVFLVDDGRTVPLRGQGPSLVPLALGDSGGVIALAPGKDDRPPVLAEAMATAEQDARAEYHRLLYVGMTRAERHLVVCGTHGANPPKPAERMWRNVVKEALAARSQARQGPPGTILAWRHPPPSPAAPAAQPATPTGGDEMEAAAPAWLFRAPPPIARAPEPIGLSHARPREPAARAAQRPAPCSCPRRRRRAFA